MDFDRMTDDELETFVYAKAYSVPPECVLVLAERWNQTRDLLSTADQELADLRFEIKHIHG